MADITVTAALVATSEDTFIESGTAGATITAGQCVYKDASDSYKYKPADADASLAASEAVGVALNGGASGQPIRVQYGGDITIGGTVAVGRIYIVSSNAGGIAPQSDLTTGWYTRVIGVGKTTSVIRLVRPFGAGVAYA